MHITVSFKDHSSICTCMLSVKRDKKTSWMIEQKQGHHHKQTNSLPMKERRECREHDGGQTDSVGLWSERRQRIRHWCVQQRVDSAEAVFVSKIKTWLYVTVASNKGYIFPQTQLVYSNWTSALQVTSVHITHPVTCRCSPCVLNLPALDILKYHVSTREDGNLCRLLAIKTLSFTILTPGKLDVLWVK